MKKEETEIVDYVKSFYKGILQENISFIYKSSQREIDLFLPQINKAIEFDGLYYHSQLRGKKYKKYHLDKLEMCLEKNIQLLQIFEDEWIYKKKIIKNKIKEFLNFQKIEINFSKCDIKVINDINIINKFLLKYDIFGRYNYGCNIFYIGFYYKNRLSGMICIEKENSEVITIKRFATITLFNSIQIFEKLLQFVENNFEINEIKFIINRRFSQGFEYSKFGFNIKKIRELTKFFIIDYKKRFKKLDIEKYKKKVNNKHFKLDFIWDCGDIILSKKVINN